MKHTMLALTMAAALAGTSAVAFAQSPTSTTPNNSTTNMDTMSSNRSNENVAAKSGMSADKVKQIQSALDQKGQHVNVGGHWGKQTASALRKFQKQNGLKATGNADQQTMQKLGLTSG
ncbi:MAG: peptidoglycan-binding protein [Alphaproteobacteria bacterium]|nr:peptidoglycan-binding protein [Alphaproteobacteria bacterium]